MNKQLNPAYRVRDFLPAVLLLLFSLLALGYMAFRPIEGAPVIAIFSPAYDQNQVLTRISGLGARIVSTSPLPFAVILQSDHAQFSNQLHTVGAWFVLDASGRGLCGKLSTKQQRILP